jgi:hypothetical protein
MLILLTLGIMGAVGYAFIREGLLTALVSIFNILLSGLFAFNFFEPLATELENQFAGSLLAGYEDALCLVVLFCVPLGLLRLITNNLAPSWIDLPALAHQIGAGLCGLVAGYLVAGFLLVLVQTLPLNEKFLGFDATTDPRTMALRRFIPPDRVWLAMLNRSSRGAFAGSEPTPFDPEADYELRYARLRRTRD